MKETVVNIFKKYDLEGYINISKTDSSILDYSPMHDEISIDNDKSYYTWVTIIKENKRVWLSFDGFSEDKLEKAILNWIKLFKYADKDKDIQLPKHSWDIDKDFWWECIVWIDFLKNELDFFLNYDFKTAKIEEFSASYKTSENIYIDSSGVERKQKNQNYTCFYWIYWEKEGLKDSTYWYITSSNKAKWLTLDDLEKVDNEIFDKLNYKQNLIKTWNYNITLDKKVVSSFISIIMDSISCESMREGLSMFSKNDIWDQIISPKLTLKSLCDIENWLWNSLFNSEWFKQVDKVLIENWVLKNKLYDYKNAKKESIDEFISSPSNLCFFWDFDDSFLANSSFLFTNLMAFHSVETSTWKFALNWEWYLIKDWEKVAFVKEVALRWDIKTLFNSIISIWNDFDEKSSYRCPSITFENQNIVV